MNDCVWSVLGDCYKECKCNRYISIDTPQGEKLIEKSIKRRNEILNEAAKIHKDYPGLTPVEEVEKAKKALGYEHLEVD